MSRGYRQEAFTSCSHGDERWAKWLHRALESYRPSKSLDTRERLKPIFRDRDELSASRDLSAEIQAALADAENLIVVCSPSAARSRWVNEDNWGQSKNSRILTESSCTLPGQRPRSRLHATHGAKMPTRNEALSRIFLL